MNSENIAQLVLQYVYSETYRPCKPKGIHKGLKLPDEAFRDVRRAIKKLVRQGQLSFGANHMVHRPKLLPPGMAPNTQPLLDDESGLPNSRNLVTTQLPDENKDQSEANQPAPLLDSSAPSDGDASLNTEPAKRRPATDSPYYANSSRTDVDADESEEDSDDEYFSGRNFGGRFSSSDFNNDEFGDQNSGEINRDYAEFDDDESLGEGTPRASGRRGSKFDSLAPRQTHPNDQTGIFRTARNHSYGFVKLLNEEFDKFGEAFIPPRFTGSAMDGDTVKVRIIMQNGDKIEGKVVEILTRARREFSGTFRMIDGQAMVWLDGANLPHPVQIGDIRGLPLNHNDKVIVELVRYPDFTQPGEAVILKVLGSNRNPAVDTMAVMHQYGLIEEFPEEAIEVARKQGDAFNEDIIPEGRTDLTQTPTITIDPRDARDFDDAISLSKNEKGNWELLVHVADVSHFVPVGSALDVEAQRRATSVYLPDRVIPMIPELISNHLASLQPDRNRLAKTVFIEYSPEGMLVHTHVFNSVIRNQYRFNYEQIDQYLADPEPWKEKLTPIQFELVGNMHHLAMLLRRIRNEKGALELTLPEVKIDLDKAGKVKGAHLVHHTESHQMIEEFMLAANQAVATWLDSLELPYLRRAHAPPNRAKLKQLNQFVQALGIEAGNLENRFEIQRVVAEVKGKPTEYAVNLAILKSMSKAVYQSAFERHYALDMSHYCHFTSPIRRYPDLVVHRIVQKLLDKEPARESEEYLEKIGEHCSSMEQNAESAERELIKVKLLHFLSKRQGELMTGVVANVKSNGLVVRAIEVPIDGIVPLGNLPDDRYRLDRETYTLEGYRTGNRFRLGDELIVRVDRIDLVRRELQFQLEKVTHSSQSTAYRGGRNRSDRPRGDNSRGDRSRSDRSDRSRDRYSADRPRGERSRGERGRSDQDRSDRGRSSGGWSPYGQQAGGSASGGNSGGPQSSSREQRKKLASKRKPTSGNSSRKPSDRPLENLDGFKRGPSGQRKKRR